MSHDIARTTRKLAATLAVTAALALAFAPTGPARADSGIEGNANARDSIVHPRAELSLRRQIVIDQDTIRLGDLFDGQISAVAGVTADTVVAYAPEPGRRAIFDAEWLSRLAQRLRLNWRPATRLDRRFRHRTLKPQSADPYRQPPPRDNRDRITFYRSVNRALQRDHHGSGRRSARQTAKRRWPHVCDDRRARSGHDLASG